MNEVCFKNRFEQKLVKIFLIIKKLPKNKIISKQRKINESKSSVSLVSYIQRFY